MSEISEKRWTKERVLQAYREWYELEDYALNVVSEMESALGYYAPCYRLIPSNWYRSSDQHPSGRVGDDSVDGERRFTLEWLWNYPNCLEEAKAKHATWLESREGKAQEKAERAEYERLKAKFGAP